jgi:hypothetical protein
VVRRAAGRAGGGDRRRLDPLLPPDVGGRGWIGVRLDTPPPIDWTEITDLCEDAYRAVAPARLIAKLGR